MTYTYEQLKDALNECTGYDLIKYDDEDADSWGYLLIDPCGDVDGDPFYELGDVEDFITNNDQVTEYLNQLKFEGWTQVQV